MPTQLFQITDVQTRKPVPGLHFSDKPSAKRHRAELNDEHGSFRYFVSPGPDHRRYKAKKK